MSKSEIFDSFVKIAQEQGLISDEKPTNERVEAEHTEKSFHDTNPRHDSYSIEQIGKLYNTKPAQPKDMEYKKNIMEDAHPEPVVLFMAHDKLNALIENENEGQNARIRITLKEPDGHLTQRKYAQKELVLSLVRLANDLDNNDQAELCKLADACLVQATAKKKDRLTKEAWIPLAIGAIVAVVGAIYAKQHLRFHSDGWSQDYEKAIGEIDDLLNASQTLGFGYTYKPELLDTMRQLKTHLGEIDAVVTKVAPVLDEIETPRTGPGITQELARLSKDPNMIKANDVLKELRDVMQKNLPFIREIISDFGNEGYKQRMTADKGTFTSWIDSAEILHGGKGLVADDFDDVAHALMTLRVDLSNIVKDLKGADNVKAKLEQQLSAAQSDLDLDYKGEQAPAQKPAETPSEQGEGEQHGGAFDALEREFKGLAGGLFGH